ncbi:MAG: hypothetical protein V1822_02990 [Candidatus Micrarchaeota archaeon]
MEPASQSPNSAKKGQITTIDLVLSISVFMVLLAIIYGAWHVKIESAASDISEFRASIAAQKALNSITNSPGFPSNWAVENLDPNSDSLKGIGAAFAHGEIDATKLAALQADYADPSKYENTKLKMGLEPFDADIRIYYITGVDLAVLGSPPASGSRVLASVQKGATYNQQPVMVRVRVWQS